MTIPSTPKLILKQLARIQRMARGKLCLIRTGPSGPYYNHQTWEQGRNVVRYVPRAQVPALQTAIAGYQDYLKLTQAYADRIIAQTRAAQPSRTPRSPDRRKPQPKRPRISKAK
ncbi:MAG: hypothetical protein WCO56_12330 [Verrucomicrobiota bacterium]